MQAICQEYDSSLGVWEYKTRSTLGCSTVVLARYIVPQTTESDMMKLTEKGNVRIRMIKISDKRYHR